MKSLAVAGVSLVALAAAAPAFAADLPAPAAPVMYDQAPVSDARLTGPASTSVRTQAGLGASSRIRPL